MLDFTPHVYSFFEHLVSRKWNDIFLAWEFFVTVLAQLSAPFLEVNRDQPNNDRGRKGHLP